MLAPLTQALAFPDPNATAPVRVPLLAEDLPELRRKAARHNLRILDLALPITVEWARTRAPGRPRPEHDVAAKAFVGDDPTAYGAWFYFPWAAAVVHLPPVEVFREVRTNRNRDKITAAEQARLLGARVGVVGLSVGHASALVLAQEGVGGELRLADFDDIELSNLNRLRTSLLHVGQTKATVTAREIAEVDPFLPVRVFPTGLTEANLEAFFFEGGKLDLLVEECDTLAMKLRVREFARQHRIPVVMDTNDRGLLDIECFHTEPDAPILHGLLGDATSASVRDLPAAGRLDLFYRFFGGEASLSPRFRESMGQLGAALVSYPQLATDVQLGGALVGHAARRVLSGDLTRSGRYRIDLHDLIPASPLSARGSAEPPSADGADVSTTPIPASLEDAERRALLEAGALAPSGGNVQPWRARFVGDDLELWLDPARSTSFLDAGRLASVMALGSFCENVVIEAEVLGRDARVELPPYRGLEGPVAVVRFGPRRSPGDPARRQLLRDRVTNRRAWDGSVLPDAGVLALERATAGRATRLATVSSDADKTRVAAILGKADRLRMFHAELHRQLFEELRWTPEQARTTRDGMDVACLEWPEPALAQVKMLSDHAALVANVPPQALEGMALDPIRASSHVACIALAGSASPAAVFDAGRALERLWLEATRLGLALQPWTVLPFFHLRVTELGGEGFSEAERAEVEGLAAALHDAFGLSPAERPLFVCRLGRPVGPPTVRSLRLPPSAFQA